MRQEKRLKKENVEENEEKGKRERQKWGKIKKVRRKLSNVSGKGLKKSWGPFAFHF